MDSANLDNIHQTPHVVPLEFSSCLASLHDPSWNPNSLLNHGYQENSMQGMQMFNQDFTGLDLNSINTTDDHVSMARFSSMNHPNFEFNTWGDNSDNYFHYVRIKEELEDSVRNFHGLEIPSANRLFPHPPISSNYLDTAQTSDNTLSAQQSLPVAKFCYEDTLSIASVNDNSSGIGCLGRLNQSYLPQQMTRQLNSNQNKRSNLVNEATEMKRINCITQSKGTQRVSKRPRVDSSTPMPPLKVRKEKLSDRISALQQLVSPFGKTDTASVLKEAIGYIKFLHNQVETLSVPYLKSSSSRTSTRTMHGMDPYETSNKVQYCAAEEKKEGIKDLRSRGLCLVPVSCMSHLISNDNVAALWPRPSFGPP